MKKLKQEEFIERANKIHNSKYTYDNTIYINTTTPICITCPVHGNFWMKPELHLIGHGCPKCAKNGIKYTNDTFIEKSREIHGDKWNYDKVKYINSQTNVIINCPIHGDFIQKPQKHPLSFASLRLLSSFKACSYESKLSGAHTLNSSKSHSVPLANDRER